MNYVVKLIRKAVLGYRASGEDYISYLKNRGCSIGENVVIFSPNTTTIDASRPVLLEIGNQVRITGGVTILTHDFSYCVCRPVFHDVVNDRSRVTHIGNNVFIGMNAVILPGTWIGDNSIIGAGAIVSKSYPDNSVIAGNPAKQVDTLENFYAKRKSSAVEDAIGYCNIFRKKMNRDPLPKEMGEYYWLFLPRGKEQIGKENISISLSGDNNEEILNDFLNSKPLFESFEQFLEVADEANVKDGN
jgi:maltose O-acetyltransferase